MKFLIRSSDFIQEYSHLSFIKEQIVFCLIANIACKVFAYYTVPVGPIGGIKLIFEML